MNSEIMAIMCLLNCKSMPKTTLGATESMQKIEKVNQIQNCTLYMCI